MINNNGWEYIYKLTNGYPCSTNVLYTPTTNAQRDRMCMHFSTYSPEYMTGSCVPRSDELMDSFFQRELKYLSLFQGQAWCPEIYEVDATERKILVEFNGESLNWPVYTEGRDLNHEFPSWKEDLYNIIKSIHDLGYHKASIYPHCFFYTKTNQLKMVDYYATLDKNDTRMHKSLIEPIIGVDSQQRFIEVKDGDYYEMADHFKNSMKTWIKWPDDPLPEFYDRIIQGIST